MKKPLQVFLILSVLFLSSCKKGEDGDVYLSILQGNYACLSYTDDNPGIPSGFYFGNSYLCSPGTYNYSYSLSDGYNYSGIYTLTAFEGTKGGFFGKGEDGQNRYYDFYCNAGGGNLYGKNDLPVINIDTVYTFEGYYMHVTGTGIYNPDFVIENPKYKTE